MTSGPTGVLLMTFGSAVTADDVPAYLASVRGGTEAPADVVAEFRHRYQRIGRSPLIDITHAQADALQGELDRRHGAGSHRVAVGMQHLRPSISDAADQLVSAGASTIHAIVLAPQYSPIILAGYERAVEAARQRHPTVTFRVAGAWHLTTAWIGSLVERLNDVLAQLPAAQRGTVPIIFTAHSLPRRVVDRDPAYIEQLIDTAKAVAARTSLDQRRWQFAYQSAGHTPEEWLQPDVKDLLPQLREQEVTDVVIVPLQFLADHLEILYDIDVAARDEADFAGIRMHRIQMPNTSPTFIGALADVVEREAAASGVVTGP
ncbi:MAG TPA: ferrochelatase [Candidatus Dormibacteraeota bacterium]|nr:ferrochelatase [Candidatus Dormibacteraeota bacterium]